MAGPAAGVRPDLLTCDETLTTPCGSSLGQRMRREVTAALPPLPAPAPRQPTMGSTSSARAARGFLGARSSVERRPVHDAHDLRTSNGSSDRIIVIDHGRLAFDGTLPASCLASARHGCCSSTWWNLVRRWTTSRTRRWSRWRPTGCAHLAFRAEETSAATVDRGRHRARGASGSRDHRAGHRRRRTPPLPLPPPRPPLTPLPFQSRSCTTRTAPRFRWSAARKSESIMT